MLPDVIQVAHPARALVNPVDFKPQEPSDVGTSSAVLKSSDLAGALHDVSNVLTVVVGWLEVALSQSGDTPPAVVDALDVALSHARFGHRVARRAIGGDTEPESACASLRDVLETSLRAIEPMAMRRQVTIAIDGGKRIDVLLAAPDAATQILVNLLLNALAFSPAGSTVQVSCKISRHSVILTVADEGPGIDPSRAERLLEIPNSTRAGGTGIGLTHSAALARDNGGHLRLLRALPHATFELRWQRVGNAPEGLSDYPADEVSRPYSSRPISVLELAGLNVLLVEDDDAICSLVELAFFARGSVVRSAATLAEAERLCSNQEFDVALVDLSPIACDVPGALAIIRGRRRIPAILITGSAMGMPAGTEGLFASWVRKPFEAGELIEAVRRVSGRA
jgi:CheY-like chemotaxis protein